MKKITVLTFFLILGFFGFAQNNYKQKTKDLIQLTSGGQFEVMIQPLGEYGAGKKSGSF